MIYHLTIIISIRPILLICVRRSRPVSVTMHFDVFTRRYTVIIKCRLPENSHAHY